MRMGHWRKTCDFKITIRGATTRLLLGPSQYGWELKGWTYTLGNAKANPEGDPLVRTYYSDLDEAYAAWQEHCVRAVVDPYERVEPVYPKLQHIDPEKQEAIDDASREDQAIRENRAIEFSRGVSP